MKSRKEEIERMLSKLEEEGKKESLAYWHFKKELKKITSQSR